MAGDLGVPLWLTIGGCIAVGIFIGMLVERTIGSAAKRAAKFEADLVQVRSDLMRYQEETARHFGKSAELLGRMASDYREFLDHFVSGAEELCGNNVKEIGILERPLLDTTSATAPRAAEPPPTDSDPLAEDRPK